MQARSTPQGLAFDQIQKWYVCKRSGGPWWGVGKGSSSCRALPNRGMPRDAIEPREAEMAMLRCCCGLGLADGDGKHLRSTLVAFQRGQASLSPAVNAPML